MQKYAYLVWVDRLTNKNKFYEATLNDDNSIDVTYGRVGTDGRQHHYQPYEKNYQMLLNQKLEKGYEDVTALHAVKETTVESIHNQYQPIEDETIAKLMEFLMQESNLFMKQNYTIKSADITQKMIDEAQENLNQLVEIAERANQKDGNETALLYRFNETLEEMFQAVPRKMQKVDDFMAHSVSDFHTIIERETDMLDNIRGQLLMNQHKQNDTHDSRTILQAFHLSVRPVTFKEEDQILAGMGADYGMSKDGRHHRRVEDRYICAYRVENNDTRQAYEDFKKEHHMKDGDRGSNIQEFYHGSKTENWLSIMSQGLSLNPQAKVTGKMFGNGIYFASDCRKALNYMDISGARWNDGKRESGFSAVYEVALGKCYEPNHVLGSRFYGKDLPKSCLSVYADKHKLPLKNDEYIVYSQAQCTIKYLVEFSKPNVREKEYSIRRSYIRDELEFAVGSLEVTPNGVQAEINLDMLSDKAQQQFEKMLSPIDSDDRPFMKHLILECTADSKIKFHVLDENYDEMYADSSRGYDFRPNATGDDLAFLAREFKKAFAESEQNWQSIMKQAEHEEIGIVLIQKESEQEEAEFKPAERQ